MSTYACEQIEFYTVYTERVLYRHATRTQTRTQTQTQTQTQTHSRRHNSLSFSGFETQKHSRGISFELTQVSMSRQRR